MVCKEIGGKQYCDGWIDDAAKGGFSTKEEEEGKEEEEKEEEEVEKELDNLVAQRKEVVRRGELELMKCLNVV